MRALRSIILAILLLCPLVAQGAVPVLKDRVTDQAGLLSSATKLKLEQFLSEFEASDSTQMAVLTVPSLEGEALDAYALKVAESWGLGQKGKDNGALLLIAQKERKVRIEVGYGLEGRLTDLLAGRIIDGEIVPRFKKGDFEGGIVAGVLAMAEAVRGEYQGSGRMKRKKDSNPLGFLALLLFFGPGLMLLSGRSGRSGRSSRRHRHGGLWIGGGGFGGRGGFGGGGFSGGGGGFGGGGASGGW